MAIRKVIPRSLDSAAASANLSFDANTLFVDSTNNVVGINTATPNSFATGLAVYNATNPSVAIVSGNANSYLRLSSTSDTDMYLSNVGGAMNFVTAGTAKMYLSSAGNVGIGIASPIYTLDVSTSGSSGALVDGARVYANASGAAESRLIFGTFAASTNAAIGAVTATGQLGSLKFYTATTNVLSEKMRIDSSGNVGIGTISPSTYGKFAVLGASSNRVFYADANAQPVARYDDNSFISNGFTLRNTGLTGSNQGIGILFQLGTGGTAIDSGAIQMRSEADYSTSANQDAAMTFSTVLNGTNTERMRIDSSGNVGIGTSSPSKKLEVYSTANSLQINAIVRNDNAGTGVAAIGFNTSFSGSEATSTKAGIGLVRGTAFGGGGLAFYNNNSGSAGDFTTADEKMRIDQSGRVLINRTSTDGGQLNITGNTSTTTRAYINATIRNARTLGTHYGVISWDGKFVADAWIGQVPGGDTLCFGHDAGTTIAEHMRIFTSGEVTIGSTTVGSAKLNVVHAGTYGVYVGGAAGASTSIIFFSGATNTGSISSNGTNTAFNTSSDYRLKENIAPITGALEKVALLKPVTYKWKSDGSDGEGFIAHELAEVCPQAVHGEKDGVETIEIKDEYDNVTGTEVRPVYQGIDTSFLVATLTAAIQEQQALITQLQADVAALKAK